MAYFKVKINNFKKYHPSGNLKIIYLLIFKSFKFILSLKNI